MGQTSSYEGTSLEAYEVPRQLACACRPTRTYTWGVIIVRSTLSRNLLPLNQKGDSIYTPSPFSASCCVILDSLLVTTSIERRRGNLSSPNNWPKIAPTFPVLPHTATQQGEGSGEWIALPLGEAFNRLKEKRLKSQSLALLFAVHVGRPGSQSHAYQRPTQ